MLYATPKFLEEGQDKNVTDRPKHLMKWALKSTNVYARWETCVFKVPQDFHFCYVVVFFLQEIISTEILTWHLQGRCRGECKQTHLPTQNPCNNFLLGSVKMTQNRVQVLGSYKPLIRQMLKK